MTRSSAVLPGPTVIASQHSRYADLLGMLVVLIMAIGTVMVFSAGADLSNEFQLKKFYDFVGMRQLLFFPMACVVMYVASAFNCRVLSFERGWFRSLTGYVLILSVALLIIVLIPQLGTEINRARRWLRIPLGPVKVSFQPSELAKWTMVVFVAAVAARFGPHMKRYWKCFLPVCLVVGLIAGLIVVEDFGTAAFVALVGLVLLVVAGVRLWHILTLLPVALSGFAFALLTSPHRVQRLLAFLQPEQWGGSAAYQANQSLIAIGSGGVWGKGLGRGICKYGHLPEDTTDFIFAIVGEELGLFGTVGLICLFVLFVILGCRVALRCQDRFGRLLAIGIVLTIGAQAAINIGVVTVVLPTKGIPLPFVSAGGTSLLLSAAAVGLLLNIAKTDALARLPET